MDETTVGIVLLLLFFLAAGFGIIKDNNSRRKRFLEKMINSWGEILRQRIYMGRSGAYFPVFL